MKGILVSLMALSVILLAGCQGGSDLTNSAALNQLRTTASPLQTASIGDYVWLDENMDGIQDTMESGMADVMVELYNCDDSLIASTMTDEDGMYMFDSLDAGNYYLEFTAPEGYMFTLMDQGDDDALDSDVDPETGTTECFEVAADQAYPDYDAGLVMEETGGCTYGKGFWKNHTGLGPQPDLVTDLLPLWLGDEDSTASMEVTTAQMAFDVLQQHMFGDPSNGITKLYAHLLTAKLNIANGADDEDIAQTIMDADNFLGMNGWEGWGDLSQDDRQMVMDWKDMLESYNEGMIGPGSCDEYDMDD